MDYQSSKTFCVLKAFFGSIGFPPELALPIGLLEVIGGIFLLVGVVTRITAALFVIDDWCHSTVKISKGFVVVYELDMLSMRYLIKKIALSLSKIVTYRLL